MLKDGLFEVRFSTRFIQMALCLKDMNNNKIGNYDWIEIYKQMYFMQSDTKSYSMSIQTCCI